MVHPLSCSIKKKKKYLRLVGKGLSVPSSLLNLLFISYCMLYFYIFFTIINLFFFPFSFCLRLLLIFFFLPNFLSCCLCLWIQGLGWYAKRLRIDEDGDVADEFLDEVSSHTSANVEEQHRTLPTFKVRYSTRPAKVQNQVLTPDGKIQQCVEYQGRLQWV